MGVGMEKIKLVPIPQITFDQIKNLSYEDLLLVVGQLEQASFTMTKLIDWIYRAIALKKIKHYHGEYYE